MSSAADLIWPALCADSLCLGPHWIYDQQQIVRAFPGGIRQFAAPLSRYHPEKKAGDFTHYGDQMLALLRSVVSRGGFQVEGWREDWARFWSGNIHTYRDGATRQTLENWVQGLNAPSDSSDLAGASRLAPVLVLPTGQRIEAAVEAARNQTALTHGNDSVQDVAEFVTRTVLALREGVGMLAALEIAAQADYRDLDAKDAMRRARQQMDRDPLSAGQALGLACDVRQALPLTLCLALKFADAPREALIQNAMAGGDSAARGLLLGLLMGAAHGRAWLPQEWIEGLNAAEEIRAWLAVDETVGAAL